ncbi:MAG: putative enoyl-CoA hydratase 1 [Steroidobacteraceae bacterium]|nr:putative enoyl-CoA hydratase 1 [Steroidobacteraceae bacterium]
MNSARPQIRFDDLPALTAAVSEEFSPWGPPLKITQELISAFARLTHDEFWLHVDPERARRDSPTGTTIAHGFLVLSLAPALKTPSPIDIAGFRRAFNAGLDRVRFVRPVPVDCEIIGRMRLAEARAGTRGTRVKFEVQVQVVGDPGPALAYELLVAYE